MANRNVLFLEDKSIFFSLRARFLALRCNFEFLLEDNTQKGPFFAHCQNFRTFINKQKDILAEPRRKTYLNHTDILESLAKALNKNYISKQKVIEIAQTINDAPSLVAWQYLQDKLRQLTPKN